MLGRFSNTQGRMMEQRTVEQRVQGCVAEVAARYETLRGKVITPEARLIEDFGMDSLDQVELAMEVEKEFDLDIAMGDGCQWATVQDVIDETKKTLAKLPK